MSNTDITYIVGGGCLLLGLIAFVSLVVSPALSSYRTVWERGIALVLSAYVLAALVGVGVLLGLIIIVEWPRYF